MEFFPIRENKIFVGAGYGGGRGHMSVITALGSLRQKDCQKLKVSRSYTMRSNTAELHRTTLSQKILPRNPLEATEGQEWPWSVKVTMAEECEGAPTCLDSR